MRALVHRSLLAKVMAWLLLHLVILTLGFFLFVKWQLGFGLDSLLSGSAGDRLRAFGESVRAEMMQYPRESWNEAVKPLADRKHVIAAIYDVGDSKSFPAEIPSNIRERAKIALPPQAPPRNNPPPGLDMKGRPSEGVGGGEWMHPPGGPGRGERPPPEDAPPHRGRESGGGITLDYTSRPLFLLRGQGGDGYWAGVQLSFPGIMGRPPRHHLLLIRSEALDGAGMFFDFKPWLWGGLAVLALSVALWAPFIWQITRYLNRLSSATERIASGDFKISIPPRGNDELGHLGEALASMALRLDQSISRQKRFLGDAAHELCAPLARLRTGLGILEMKIDRSEISVLGSIESDAEELAGLVEEILSFSRSGNLIPRMEPVILKKLIQTTVAREAGSLEVKIDVSPDLIIVTDASLVGRALGNLVRNARIHAGSEAKVSIATLEASQFITISVTDNGPGVDPDEIPRLFEPFYRPDRSRSRDTGGSGLGLAIVRTAVEACGGEALANLASEGGFVVTIRLPKAGIA